RAPLHEVAQRPLQEQDQRNRQHQQRPASISRPSARSIASSQPMRVLPPIGRSCYRLSMAEPNDEVLIGRLVRAFGGVPGVRAIVLGGSRARGEATAQSDYDIGLYYEPDSAI